MAITLAKHIKTAPPGAFACYRKDKLGTIRAWVAWGDSDGYVNISYGVFDSSEYRTEAYECQAKNVGKENETTPEEQSWLEAESRWKKKLKAKYYKTTAEAFNQLNISPMLAEGYEKYPIIPATFDKGVWVQPKLDGMRCLAIIDLETRDVQLKSRAGAFIETCPHIVEYLKRLDISELKGGADPFEPVTKFERDDGRDLPKEAGVALAKADVVVLDGELYAHGLSFQENMSLIKKYRPGESEVILYNTYDCFLLGKDEGTGVQDIMNLDYYVRREILDLVHNNLIENVLRTSEQASPTKYCVNVETIEVFDIDEIKEYQGRFVGEGYEGTIVRANGPYKLGSRSKDLLKLKDFDDADAIVVDVLPSDKRPDWGYPILRLPDPTGEFDFVEFGSGVRLSVEEKKDLLVNKENYIGQIANLRFFGYSEEGVPRFPVIVGFHEDRDAS